jgi:hypothetical protein
MLQRIQKLIVERASELRRRDSLLKKRLEQAAVRPLLDVRSMQMCVVESVHWVRRLVNKMTEADVVVNVSDSLTAHSANTLIWRVAMPHFVSKTLCLTREWVTRKACCVECPIAEEIPRSAWFETNAGKVTTS